MTVGAAILGGAVTVFYSAAHPAVAVIDIKPSLSLNGRFVSKETEVAISDSLRARLEKTLYASLQAFRSPRARYSDLVEGLNSNEERMNTLIASVVQFRQDLPKLKDILQRGPAATPEEKNEFFDRWERNDAFIYGSIRGEFRRGQLEVSKKEYVGEPALLLREETISSPPGSLWVVSKKGGRFGSFLIPETGRDFTFQESVARALAYLDVQMLKHFLEVAERDTADVGVAKEIIADIEHARDNISRWAISVSVTNTGTHPIALLPVAELLVDTSGLIGSNGPISGETEIRLELRNENSEAAPEQVSGNGAALIVFASEKFIQEEDVGRILIDSYRLGARSCRVRIYTAGGGVLTPKVLISRAHQFGPASTISRQ